MFQILDRDQPGLFQLLHLRRFLTEIAPFERLRPAPDLIPPAAYTPGHRPLALASPDCATVAVYLPVGDPVDLALPKGAVYEAQWFDPLGGNLSPVQRDDPLPTPTMSAATRFAVPIEAANPERDWALVLMGAP